MYTDEGIHMEDEETVETSKQVGRVAKTHERPVCGMWAFKTANGQIGVITVGHDCAKLWRVDETRHTGDVTLVEKLVVAKWRPAVQSCDATADGNFLVVIGIDSKVYEIALAANVAPVVHDFGLMEANNVSIGSDKQSYITASFTGFLSEVEPGTGKFKRREPFEKVKHISCLKYSNDMSRIAVGHNDGIIDIHETSTMKHLAKFEVHSKKIRKIEFLPGDERFLSACDDRTIKMCSLTDMTLYISVPTEHACQLPFGEFDRVTELFSWPKSGNDPVESSRHSKPLRIFEGHDGEVLALTVDARTNGTRFATSNINGQIFVWHVEMTNPIIVIPSQHRSQVTALTFSPTGRHLIAASADLTFSIFTVPKSGAADDEEEEEEVVHVPFGVDPEVYTAARNSMEKEDADLMEEDHDRTNLTEGSHLVADQTQMYSDNTQNYADDSQHAYNEDAEYQQTTQGSSGEQIIDYGPTVDNQNQYNSESAYTDQYYAQPYGTNEPEHE